MTKSLSDFLLDLPADTLLALLTDAKRAGVAPEDQLRLWICTHAAPSTEPPRVSGQPTREVTPRVRSQSYAFGGLNIGQALSLGDPLNIITQAYPGTSKTARNMVGYRAICALRRRAENAQRGKKFAIGVYQPPAKAGPVPDWLKKDFPDGTFPDGPPPPSALAIWRVA